METSSVKAKLIHQKGAIPVSPDTETLIELHQYMINQPDSLLKQLFEMFTFVPGEEIEQILSEHNTKPENKHAHKRLIKELVFQITGDQNSGEQISSYQRYFSLNFDTLVHLLATKFNRRKQCHFQQITPCSHHKIT